MGMKKNKENDERFKNALLYNDHQLKTRRDFLGAGLLGMSGWVMGPSLLSFLHSQTTHAQAATCTGPQVIAGKTPVIIFDLAGGANIAGSNVMVGGAGGQMDFLQEYKTLGLPMDMHPSLTGQINNEMGLLFHGDSAILRGIQSTSNAQVRTRCDGGVFCTSSSDDTQNNPHNPMYWLNSAGARGELAQLVGTRNSVSGGRSISPDLSVNPSLRPVQINRPEDALGLVNTGRLGELFNKVKTQRILTAIQRMSERKFMSFNQQSLPMQIKQLVNCGYISSKDMINRYNADTLDPRNDVLVNQAFDNLGDGKQRKAASIAKLVLDGYAGAGTIDDGGYDYHNKTRATGETKDFRAGALIGQVLQLASLKQKNVLIYVITDGAVAAREEIDNSNDGRGKYVWTGDSGQRSSAFTLLYRHQGRAGLRMAKRQIGHFKPNGAVENSATPSSNSVTNLAKLFVANYLALHGDEGRLVEVVGDNPFGGNLDQYLLFNKIA
jgi:hypothetical protein